jgi:orotate phosphoribosyltransferase
MDSIQAAREQVLRLAEQTEAIVRDQVQPRSGEMASWYFDARRLCLSRSGMWPVGEACGAMLYDLDFEAVGGPACGAIPLVCACAMVMLKDAFYTRSVARDHGLGRVIEGGVAPGTRVVIMEDVTTTEDNLMESIRTCQDGGLKVVGALALLDRGGVVGERLEIMGIPFRAILRRQDVEEKVR